MTMRIGVSGIAGKRQMDVSGETFHIGSDASCQVSIPEYAGIKPRHAVIRRVAGRWMIQAVEDDLLQVGTETPARMQWIKPGDVIRLTAAGPDLIFDATAPVAPVEGSRDPVVVTPTRHRSTRLRLAGYSAIVLCVGLVIALLVARKTEVADRPALVTSELATPAQAHAASPGVAGKEQPPIPQKRSVEAQGQDPGASKNLRETLYLVVVQNSDQKQTYQLGTAWGVGKRQLASSAAVLLAIEDLRDIASQSGVLNPNTKQQLKVVATKIHPAYRQAVADAKSAQAEAEAARLELGEKTDAPMIDALTQRIVAAEERRFEALERQVNVDVGLIEVAEDLPPRLPLADAPGTDVKVGGRLKLLGVPFLQDEYVVDVDALAQPLEVSGTLLARMPFPGANRQPSSRLVFKCREDFPSQQNWSGSPLLNSVGRVVAIYSRPTPPLSPTAATTVVSHDAAEIGKLRELMQEGR